MAAEPAPETRTVRFCHSPSICVAPQYLAGDLLRDGRLQRRCSTSRWARGAGPDALAEGRADITMWYATGFLPVLDAGKPVVVLAGMHRGCWELFGHESVRACAT